MHMLEFWKAVFISSILLIPASYFTYWIGSLFQKSKTDMDSASFFIGMSGLFIALAWLTDGWVLLFGGADGRLREKPASFLNMALAAGISIGFFGIVSSLVAFFIINNNL